MAPNGYMNKASYCGRRKLAAHDSRYAAAGCVDPKAVHNNFAVVLLGLCPSVFMVLPFLFALDRLDKSLIEASLDLGAGHFAKHL
jgi:ABC-type spermidine/putrescine transport system permease subunit I